MKRTITILITLCLLIGLLAACNGTAPDNTDGATPDNTDGTTPGNTTTGTTTPPAGATGPASEGIEQTLNLCQDANRYNDYDFKHPWVDIVFNDRLIWLTLLQADKDLQAAAGGIMSDWTVSSDGMTITLTMRDDLFWSDGTPITMDDVLWTFDRLCEQNLGSIIYIGLTYIEGQTAYANGEADSVSGITASGNVLTFKLRSPYASFLNIMAQVAPLPKHVYENCDFSEGAAFNRDPIWREIKVNSGPFVVGEHVENNYYIMEPNPFYKGAESKINKVVVTITDAWTAMAQTNNIDFWPTYSMDTYTILSDLDAYRLEMAPIIYFRNLAFNFTDADGNRRDHVTDLRVRQAIAFAVDWKSIISSLFGDLAALTQSGVLSSSPDYAGDWYSYDPAKAKALLDEANFDYSKPIRILYYYADQTSEDIMEAVAYYLEQVGIQVDLFFSTNAGYDLYEGRTQDVFYAGQSAFDNLTWYQMYLRANMDIMLGCTEVFADAVARLETAFTPELQKSALAELQKIERETVFFLPVYTLNYQYWLSDRLSVPENMFGNNWYFYDIQFENWEIVK